MTQCGTTPTVRCPRRCSRVSTACATARRPATCTTRPRRRRCSCAFGSTRRRSIRPVPRSSSPRSTTPTTSASTRTPASPTSPATAPLDPFRLPRATAARCGTSPATRSTRQSSVLQRLLGPRARRRGQGHVRHDRRRHHRPARRHRAQRRTCARRTQGAYRRRCGVTGPAPLLPATIAQEAGSASITSNVQVWPGPTGRRCSLPRRQ